MRKKIVSFGIGSGIIITIIILSLQNFEYEPESESDQRFNSEKLVSKSEIKNQESEILTDVDIIMPTKVSRPGCEIKDSCYVPSKITIYQGEEVTWSNEDAAFHSVTSGSYEKPTDLFDSGYMDPGQKFTISFENKGEFDYFCTLHPWMKGKVIVA